MLRCGHGDVGGLGLAERQPTVADTHLERVTERGEGQHLDRQLDRVRAADGRLLNLGVRNAPQPRDLPAVARLRAMIRKVRPDVVHAHSSKAGALVRGLGLFGMLGHRAQVFYTPHSYYLMHAPERPKARGCGCRHAYGRLPAARSGW